LANRQEAEAEAGEHPFRKTTMRLVLRLEVEVEVVLVEEAELDVAEEEISPM